MKQTKYYNVYVDGEDIYRVIKGEYHKLSKWIDNVGYYQVAFRIDGHKKYIRVHRLIAETLLPNPHNLKQVDHKDGNKLNNNIDNLEWVNNSTNTQRGYDLDCYHSKQRSHPIKAIHKETHDIYEFKSIRSCADTLQLNKKTITAILKHGKTNNYLYDFEYL